MGVDVGVEDGSRIEITFEEVNNENINVELIDNPVTIELDTPGNIQVSFNEQYSDVNVILDHNKQINRNLNKQHTAETIQESITKRFTSDTEISNLEPKKGADEFYVSGDERDYCLTRQIQYFVTTQVVNGFSITTDTLGNPIKIGAGVYVLLLFSTGGGQGSAGVPFITFNGINTGGNFRQVNDGGVKYPGLFSSRFDKQYTAITLQLTITPSGRVVSEGNGVYVLSDSDTNPSESRSRGFSLINYTLPITRIDMISTSGLTINTGLIVQLIRLR